MDYKFCNHIVNLATKSILYEVAATPKPGLVDRSNSGAHNDMDFFTFLSSSSVLSSYFYQCTKAGLEFTGEDYKVLLSNLRPIGIIAENDMFKATNGVNTHKGMIFSQGIVAAAAGSIFRETGDVSINALDISNRTMAMAEGLTNELRTLHSKDTYTYGEYLYIKYNIKGIRGEVESGFKTVMNYSLPLLSDLMNEKQYKINDILVHTLLYLIANTEDGNILGRHNMDQLIYAQKSAKQALDLGGYLVKEGREYVEKMDKDFIEKNISPGGAADLLAITLLLYYLQTENEF